MRWQYPELATIISFEDLRIKFLGGSSKLLGEYVNLFHVLGYLVLYMKDEARG